MGKLPYIGKENGIHTLFVDGDPYVALAGEIHNSSSSSLEYMQEKVWPNLRDLNLNTLLVPVFWEIIEPIEGCFDFELVDGIIEQAREENLRIVLLWFGLWKNGTSSYVPGWVKKNSKKYFRARYMGNQSSDTISPLCDAAVKADAKAFKMFMSHLKEVDGDKNTVIMIQVENEIGFLKSERDFSDLANEEFEKVVPLEISIAFGKSGKWYDVFGFEANEYFMAYYYASAVEQIIKSGTEVYPLPMYVNAWLEQFPERAGEYPSGGPIAKTMEMWKIAAPGICLYAPDIYVPNFADVCEEYSANDNPLFIPETRRDVVSAANVFYAIGKYNAICFSPFGIEDFLFPTSSGDIMSMNNEMLMALNIDSLGFSLNGTGQYLSKSYMLLGNMMGIINKYRGTGKMKAFLQNNDNGCIISFSEYDLKLTYNRPKEGIPTAGGIIIEVSQEKFILVGTGFSAEFLPKCGEKYKVGYLKIEEGTFQNNIWLRGRVFNGDESMKISLGTNPAAICVEMYKYK